MKLYASVSSERATKGQGGEWLDILIENEQRVPCIAIKVRQGGESGVYAWVTCDYALANASIAVGEIVDVDAMKREIETKDEQKKDETCSGKHDSVQDIINCRDCSRALKSM